MPRALYDVLENQIIPLYYTERNADNVPLEWLVMMKKSMQTIIPQFSTRRMLKEYIERLYLPGQKLEADLNRSRGFLEPAA